MNSVNPSCVLLVLLTCHPGAARHAPPALKATENGTEPQAAVWEEEGRHDSTNNLTARASGGVLGGPHDLSRLTGRASDACSACHVPHVMIVGEASTEVAPSGSGAAVERVPSGTGGRIPPGGETPSATGSATAFTPGTHEAGAAQATSETILKLYRMEGQRATFEPGRFTPGATSLICLGCHDGTVASSVIGTSHAVLSGVREGFSVPAGFVWRDHPVGVAYPRNRRDYVPLARVESQGRIRLPEARVECVSCHEPHNAAGEPYMLSVSNRRSALCLSCHVK